jgi:ribosome-binding factor A
MVRNITRPTGACAKGVNHWQKYFRSRALKNVRLASVPQMKNVLLNRCLTPASLEKLQVVLFKQALFAKD